MERLRAFRAATFRLDDARRVRTRDEAVQHVNERGFIYFWPVKEAALPSLWSAVAGDRVVADAHDDPGHITWRWKDESLGTRTWYYAKILRRRATLIALAETPAFYALSENYGEPEHDYLIQYQEGRMSLEAKQIFETLLAEGPLDTVSLRQKARMTSQASNGLFTRAMEHLQADFKILPVKVAEVGAWKYAFVYDMVHRHYPDLPEQARAIRQSDARRRLAELYFRSVGAAQARQLAGLFGWPKQDWEPALAALVRDGIVCADVTLTGEKGEWYALPELLG
jgi:hypothetical protein